MTRLWSASSCFHAAFPEPLRGASGVDDVGHEDRGDDAFVLSWHADRSDIAEDVHQDDRLVTDDPGIVSGRDVEDVARPELGRLAIVHLHPETTRQQDLEVMDLA